LLNLWKRGAGFLRYSKREPETCRESELGYGFVLNHVSLKSTLKTASFSWQVDDIFQWVRLIHHASSGS
jgi:hypothetical protein